MLRSLNQYIGLLIATSVFILISFPIPLRAGSESGGGGDASEARIDEIRGDLLTWINDGGAQGLTLPARITLRRYQELMTEILAPQRVVVTFVTTLQESQSTDPERKVLVDEQPKTCRGFIGNLDQLRHILCNQERFAATSEAEQYRLVHHEYAGLAGVEQNVGAASDYEISNQLTDFLHPTTVLRLSVKRRTDCSIVDGLRHCPEDIADIAGHVLQCNVNLAPTFGGVQNTKYQFIKGIDDSNLAIVFSQGSMDNGTSETPYFVAGSKVVIASDIGHVDKKTRIYDTSNPGSIKRVFQSCVFPGQGGGDARPICAEVTEICVLN